ncbi:MAG: aldose 1-epimerase family protein [Lacipirellulaceae bacterium]
MPSHTWTLTDVERGIHENKFRVSASDLPGAVGNWEVTQQTLQGGLSEGVDLLTIDNGLQRIHVLPTRGMGIWNVERDEGQSLGWRSPVRGPVHPSFVSIHDPSGLGWLEGFDELIVRCGLESNGAPEFGENGELVYPLHGRIANRPAHCVEVTVNEEDRTIIVRGLVEESRFHFQKLRLEVTITTSFDASSFTQVDRVENFGGTAAQMQMLYHINVGEPLLGPGAEFVAHVREIAPRDAGTEMKEDWRKYGPAVAGQSEDCYFLELVGDEHDHTKVLLKSADGAQGLVLEHDTKELPYFSLWKNEVASEDGYVTGLEPATNYPNGRSVEEQAGRVITLEAGESWSAELTLDWLANSEQVQEAQTEIERLSTQGS